MANNQKTWVQVPAPPLTVTSFQALASWIMKWGGNAWPQSPGCFEVQKWYYVLAHFEIYKKLFRNEGGILCAHVPESQSPVLWAGLLSNREAFLQHQSHPLRLQVLQARLWTSKVLRDPLYSTEFHKLSSDISYSISSDENTEGFSILIY